MHADGCWGYHREDHV
jgi:hypothetical protein